MSILQRVVGSNLILGNSFSSKPCPVTLPHRMLEGHQAMDPGFTREAATALCVRGSKKLPNGYYQFTRDLMLKTVSITSIL